MTVKTTEFTQYYDKTLIANGDDGLFFVLYSPVEDLKVPTVRKSYSWTSSTQSFDLQFEKPKPRNVLRTVIVMKTSANCYQVTYADTKGCARSTCKNYDEIHAFLRPLWERSLS